MTEPLLRMPDGSYASRDGRFYFDRVSGNRWRAIDASRKKSVESCFRLLSEAKAWMKQRRKVRP